MQTWAKRGMRAALVTGGVLAVGTGSVASAEDNSDQPTLGDGQLTWDDVHNDGGSFTTPHADSTVLRMAGNLDSERDLLPAVENEHTREIPALTDAPGADPTVRKPRHQSHRADPATRDRGDSTPQASRGGPRHQLRQHDRLADSVELAGWVAGPDRDERTDSASPVRVGTPSEGFHRSLSWEGPVGAVVHGQNAQPGGGTRPVMAQPLVTPGEDLVYADDFDQSDRVNRWEAAARARTIGLGSVVDGPTTELPAVTDNPTAEHEVPVPDTRRDGALPVGEHTAESPNTELPNTGLPNTGLPNTGLPNTGLPNTGLPSDGSLSGGLLSPVATDLTAADLSRSTELHPVPHRVLNQALAASGPVTLGNETNPLRVPGEYQDRVDEVPSLRGLAKAAQRSVLAQPAERTRSVGPAKLGDTGKPDDTAKMGDTGKPDDTETTTPFLRPIEAALRGAEGSQRASVVRFAQQPQRSDVSVRTLDELTAGMPEREWATHNPFPVRRGMPAMPSFGMALPGLDDGQRADMLATPGIRV